MKRYLFSGLVAILATAVVPAFAHAAQIGLYSNEADLNGDGQVTLTELKIYNRAQRHS